MTRITLCAVLWLTAGGEAFADVTPQEKAAGFVSLFDGKTLDGWQGALGHWAPEDGRLVYRGPKARSSKDLPDLKLMSKAQYRDFILRFEFKLERRSNSGVAIRAPLEGDPAFAGMEIQVIDTPRWKDLKPYQVHGSIYGVVPAKRGHLKPLGQWNSEEILCDGRRVRVRLNGEVIVDADLDEIGEKTINGRAHPGLKRDRGRIGFLGHTRRVEFRRIRLLDLRRGGYFPPPESKGGWRKLEDPGAIRRVAGMDPEKLRALEAWLRQSDRRDFAAVVIRRGYIVLEVERGNSSRTDARRVASVSKAICATVLAIASERSRRGRTPREMSFDDPAFEFIPWAKPLSDPRKAKITVKQLLNHTSGICPEATGASNRGKWEYILGHTGDARTAKLAFAPGTACGYSTHALHHASLVCENVTGKPYDRFAIEALLRPTGVEKWWFQRFDGGEKYGRHPSHGMGMPARDLARIAYCMLRRGRWGEKQVVPRWFVDETAAPTHDVEGKEMRFKINARTFSHGWELPARLDGEGTRSGRGIPPDARYKPGSGGQMIAFVPSLDLVVTRQTGSSGDWEYQDYVRRACAAVISREGR